MARTKRKINHLHPVEMPAPEQAGKRIYRAAGYARLSVEDSGKPGADTIESQKGMLLDYIENREDMEFCGIYCDNGQTGVHFERPGFEALMQDVRAGKTDCIVVKDLSRFGRNYRETGNYLERIFPFMDVRFVALSDNFDTLTAERSGDGYIVPLKNIMNEMYSRDISKKTGSALAAKQRRGEFIGSWAAYGYQKCADDPHRIEPDAETAPVVREIFRLRSLGMGYRKIAQELNGKGIPAPSRYHYLKGDTKCSRYADVVWQLNVVKQILSNRVYLGHMVQGRKYASFYEGKRQQARPEKEWVVVNNTHEPLVEEEIFSTVQEMAEKQKAAYQERLGKYDALGNTPGILKKLVYCADCKRPLVRYKSVTKKGTKKAYFYICPKHAENPGACPKKYMPEEILLKILWDTLQCQARQGNIQCIVVKDLSRFGRDYLEVGNYISRVFPFLGIRFIAVNDGFDSIRPMDADSLETSFKMLLYDIYSRDISRKTRSAIKYKAQKGEFTAPFAPYGYQKDPEKKNCLAADPETAGTVKRIFQMAADGKTTEEIARVLNLERVPTPMQQKRIAGCRRRWKGVHEDNFWMRDTVRAILRDERYTGMNIFGKRARDEIGRNHTVKKDRSDWICTEGAHQGIVTKEEFERAQEWLRKFAGHGPGPGQPCGSPFLKKVRCGVCGHIMARIGKKNPYYICHTPRVTDAYACPAGRVAEKDLADALLEQLRAQASYAVDMARIWEEKHCREKQDIKGKRKEIACLEESVAALERHMREIYEKTVFGEMDKGTYLEEKNAAAEKKAAVRSRIAELEAGLQNAGAGGKLENKFADSFARYAETEELTAEIAAYVLQEVTVYPGKVLHISWNYQDELEKLLLDINMENETEKAPEFASRPKYG